MDVELPELREVPVRVLVVPVVPVVPRALFPSKVFAGRPLARGLFSAAGSACLALLTLIPPHCFVSLSQRDALSCGKDDIAGCVLTTRRPKWNARLGT